MHTPHAGWLGKIAKPPIQNHFTIFLRLRGKSVWLPLWESVLKQDLAFIRSFLQCQDQVEIGELQVAVPVASGPTRVNNPCVFVLARLED